MMNDLTRTRLYVCVLLAAILISNPVFAESIGQKVLRLRKEKKEGKISAYTRSKTLAVKDENPKTAAREHQTRNQSNINTYKAVSSAPKARASQIKKVAVDASDPLNLVPADALVCVRINGFSDTLQNLDQYLTGVSPMPLSMMATTQIGTILGNQMMTGIDLNGSPVLFGKMGPSIAEPYGILLLPVTSYEEFISQNPSASEPDSDGIVTITPPQSPLGPIAAAEAPGGKYAYITLAPTKQMITNAKESLAENKSITNSLEALETNRAIQSPLWAYGNLEIAVKTFEPMIKSWLQMIQMQATQAAVENPNQVNPEQVKTGMALIQNSLDQLKSLSIALDPKPAKTSISIAFTAKPGTELAKALVPAPTIGEPFTLAGTLDKPAGMNVLAKINKSLGTEYYDLIHEISPDTASAEIKQIAKDSISAYEDHTAMSLDFDSDEFVEIRVFSKIKAGVNAEDMIKQEFKLAEYNLSDSGMKSEFEVTTSTYNSNKIYIAKSDILLDPQKKITIPLQINAAIVDNIYYICSGDVKNLYNLIDRGIPSPSTATGDMKTALNLIDNPEDYDIIASYNIIRLMSGIGKIMPKMVSAQEQEIPNIFENFGTEAKSCAAVTGKIFNGSACMDIILPKAHLMEVFQAAMQMQQRMMQQMMQQNGPQATPNMMPTPDSMPKTGPYMKN